ncbi:allophycocyanin [Aphanothece hegewaldii CCALA 016]|uniref:Allophycocyanin n=1 Tax=Aphanothece hegewaldii CCALA 016 TaxID=2107694 RepID=A0A2T1M0N2_9CHRO|nr:allophycocyanin [Aphanothece hegewaldii]PSF38207.1 allophycocyanin [Aphanothece hegewaldii CCALA 016]
MLKQLASLSIKTDGRYATESELKFLKDYLDSVELRISTYEKIRDQEEEILQKWEAVKRSHTEDLYHMGDYDMTKTCRRDQTNSLRFATTAMLLDELDRFREGTLIWYKTIVNSFKYQAYAKVNYLLIQEVIRLYLSAEEVELINPAFQLEHTILSSN